VRVQAIAGAATLFAVAALFVSVEPPVAGYAESAPPGFSGGFKEQSCHACHFHENLNSGPGRVAITGVPATFAARERYAITVTLTHPQMKLAGFQLTTRFQDGGAQAGTLAPGPGEEERIGIDAQGDVQYANQRRKGAALSAPETARWSLVWIAPETTDPVVFHVAANAANDDGTAEGDYIHTAAVDALPDRRGAQ
jgi:hypothetical protein